MKKESSRKSLTSLAVDTVHVLIKRRLGLFAIIISLFASTTLVVAAESSSLSVKDTLSERSPLSAENSHVRVSLFSEQAWIEPGESTWLAIRFEMDEGWHTYWKNPGDSGMPTQVEWKLPEGLSVEPMLWPAPSRIEIPPLVNFGYEGEAIFLIRLAASADLEGPSASLRADVRWVECAEICVPGKTELVLELPVKRKPAAAEPVPTVVDLFRKARESLPATDAGWMFRAAVQRKFFGLGKRQVQLIIDPPAETGRLNDLFFFPVQSGFVEPSAPQRTFKKDAGYGLAIPLESEAAIPEILQGVFVAEQETGGDRVSKAVEVAVPVTRETRSGLPAVFWLALGSVAVALVGFVAWGLRKNLKKSAEREEK